MAEPLPQRDEFRHFLPIQTRWSDNDQYGHANNVVYYSYFDTAVNQHLIDRGVLDPGRSSVIGVVVETGCQFRRPVGFPDPLEAGLRVVALGTRSVRYEIGIFRAGEREPVAFGHFVHVYVDRKRFESAPIPGPVRAVLLPLFVQQRSALSSGGRTADDSIGGATANAEQGQKEERGE